MSQQEIYGEEVYTTWRDVPIPKKNTVFSFRVPGKLMQQLKYIADETALSVNAICLMAVQIHTRKLLKEVNEYHQR